MVMHPNPTDFATPKPPRRLWLWLLVAAVSFGAGMSTALAEQGDGPVTRSEGPTQVCARALEASIEALDLAYRYLLTDPYDSAMLGSLDAQMAVLSEDPRIVSDVPECRTYLNE